MLKEVDSWPYSFPLSQDFPKSHQRGSVEGRLLVLDKYVSHLPQLVLHCTIHTKPINVN